MGIDAALADEFERGQPLKQRRADRRALADQDQYLGVAQTPGKRVVILDVIVPYGHVVSVKLAKAGKRSDCVVIIVQNADFHLRASSRIMAAPFSAIIMVGALVLPGVLLGMTGGGHTPDATPHARD